MPVLFQMFYCVIYWKNTDATIVGIFNKPDTIAFNALISACKKTSNFQKALLLFDEMHTLNLPRDEITIGL